MSVSYDTDLYSKEREPEESFFRLVFFCLFMFFARYSAFISAAVYMAAMVFTIYAQRLPKPSEASAAQCILATMQPSGTGMIYTSCS